MILATLPPTTFTAGQEISLGPFTINDNVLSLMVETDQFAATANPCLEAKLERKISGNQWELAGSYTIGARTVADPKNFIRIGLYSGTNRQFRVWIKAYETVTTGARIHNSVTIGTPGSANGQATTGTVAVTVGAGANRCIIGCTAWGNEFAAAAGSMTFNSVAMTLVGNSSAANNSCQIRSLTNPASGSGTLGWSSDGGNYPFLIVGLPLEEVDQSTVVGSAVTGTGTGTPITSTVTDSVADDLIMDVVTTTWLSGSTAFSVGADQTDRSSGGVGYGGASRLGGVSTQAGGSGSQVMSWTPAGTTSNWCQVAVTIKQVGAAPPPITGTLSQTLGALTAVATGTVVSPGSATLSKTLGALTCTATAQVLIRGVAQSAGITLAWDASFGATGYRIYVGSSVSGIYNYPGSPFNVGNVLIYRLENFPNDTYYFATTAYNAIGEESGYSNELVDTITAIDGLYLSSLGLRLTATGTVTAFGAISGTLVQTLGALTVAGAGNVLISGILSQTLSALTLTATTTPAVRYVAVMRSP